MGSEQGEADEVGLVGDRVAVLQIGADGLRVRSLDNAAPLVPDDLGDGRAGPVDLGVGVAAPAPRQDPAAGCPDVGDGVRTSVVRQPRQG